MNIEQQRARGIGGVRCMHAATGQLPQQKRIDGAEQQFAGFGALAKCRILFENPSYLGAGEIGVED